MVQTCILVITLILFALCTFHALLILSVYMYSTEILKFSRLWQNCSQLTKFRFEKHNFTYSELLFLVLSITYRGRSLTENFPNRWRSPTTHIGFTHRLSGIVCCEKYWKKNRIRIQALFSVSDLLYGHRATFNGITYQ